jgi:hypothetical protein
MLRKARMHSSDGVAIWYVIRALLTIFSIKNLKHPCYSGVTLESSALDDEMKRDVDDAKEMRSAPDHGH